MEVDMKICAEILQSLYDGFASDSPVTRRERCLQIAGSKKIYTAVLQHLAQKSLIDITTIPAGRDGEMTLFPILHEKAHKRVKEHGVKFVLEGLPKKLTW
ncbi:hypothetical protein HKW65_06170 [Enterobacter ludwigii]|uniref:hypothetical protein n=1 Tax=Enterobacter ludwigii TaxID=299767 RepID=UPI002150FC99|nr:hypothetical protein [Enterobacter ludwigii]MCR5990766.1 hypothetical protein [Enterobacter ludwigii]